MPNLYVILILILIVLQWFKVGSTHSSDPCPPEANLVTNGGLFIIVLFLLVACSCGLGSDAFPLEKHNHHKCRCH